MDRSNFESMMRPAGALVAAGAILAGGVACSSDGQIEMVKTAELAAPGVSAAEISLEDANNAIPTSDEDLYREDYTFTGCGGKENQNHGKPAAEYSADHSFGYFRDLPELGAAQVSFFDREVGKEAMDVLITRGIKNEHTNPELSLDVADPTQARMNELLELRRSVELSTEHKLVNFACKDAAGNIVVIPAANRRVITVGKGQQLLGVQLDQAGFDEFVKVVRKHGDGLPVTDIVKLVSQDGKETTYQVNLWSEACENPELRPYVKPPVDTPGTVVTSTPPGMPPVTVTIPGPSDKKPRQRDHDAHPQPGGDGEAEVGMDPGSDGEDGFGPNDPHHSVPQTTSPRETVPASPDTTGPKRPVTPPSINPTTLPDPQTPPPSAGE